MRNMVLLRLPLILALVSTVCSVALGQEISYDAATSILTIPSVKVGTSTYTNVTLRNIGNYNFTLQTAILQVPASQAVATYDGPSATLTLPSVKVGTKTYAVTMQNIGDYRFSLKIATEVQTFIFYSKNSPAQQTAILSNGTLTMDGLKITGFSFGGSASDATHTLTQWASPWNNYNQPVVPAMLFCGADGKLTYVLLATAANEPGRISATAPQLVDSVHSASQYDGINVYRNCGGSFSDKWQNNLPLSNYLLYSDFFNTYSYATVVGQLDGAVIYRETGVPSNFHNFLAITWHGGSGNTFEVWQ